ncbi:MAG: hypothetical protein M0P31_17020 [Solirubrobacteraceae bacterium]|nr:hypothetical protein [Solirubrobacteraceae bacterium]
MITGTVSVNGGPEVDLDRFRDLSDHLANEDVGSTNDPAAGGPAQLSLEIGGDRPTTSLLKIGGSIDLGDIEVTKGRHLKIRVVDDWTGELVSQADVRIDAVTIKDKIDADGYVTATERIHAARVDMSRPATTPDEGGDDDLD